MKSPSGLNMHAGAMLLSLLTLGLAGATSTGATFTDQSSAEGTIRVSTWFFLHNQPMPPIGDTRAVRDLEMDAVTPLQPLLFNYDTNRDGLPGRAIRRGGSGVDDSRLAYYANWLSPPFLTGTVIDGVVTARTWSGVIGFPPGARGVLVAYLRDYDPVTRSYATIASATLDLPDWQGGSSTWVERRIEIPVVGYALAAGRQLELKLQVDAAASADMIIAYDTVGYPSALALPWPPRSGTSSVSPHTKESA